MKKNIQLFGRGLILPAILLASLILISCKDDEDDPADTTVEFRAALNGSSEVPPNNSTASGTATLTYDTLANKFDIQVTYNGFTATGAHIHQGEPGVSGGVVFGFPDPITSPINYTSPVLTDIQEAALFAGQYYVNIHSAAFPNGEIRGQLIRNP